jgi:hypothetical protein
VGGSVGGGRECDDRCVNCACAVYASQASLCSGLTLVYYTAEVLLRLLCWSTEGWTPTSYCCFDHTYPPYLGWVAGLLVCCCL